MIQIQDKNVENQVYFPKSTNINGDLVLRLHSELTQKDYTFDVVNESKTSNYYKFNVNFKSVENGEYTYFINDTDSGLIRIGNVNEAVSTSTYIDGIEVVQYYPQDVRETNYSKEPLTFKILSYGTINWTTSDSSNTKTIEYKLNDGEWTHITSNTEGVKITVNTGDKIQFRGDNTSYSDGLSYNRFGSSTAEFEVEGNIMSLIYGDNFKNKLTISSDYTFYGLFENCTGLTSAENLILPATTLTDYCYAAMFQNCTSLITAPKALPATTLAGACYSSMFSGCSSLTTAPALPATTLANYCYQYMFQDCTSLTTATALPATTLAGACYYGMFYGCSSLTTVPSNLLPATKLEVGCYNYMFCNCTSLTEAPVLPATTLAEGCYYNMFRGCASLTTAPELPATTLAMHCYTGMFTNCTKLNYIKCLATDISATYCTNYWVKGVASTGTFIKAAGMTSWTTGGDGIPTGWTIENNIN